MAVIHVHCPMTLTSMPCIVINRSGFCSGQQGQEDACFAGGEEATEEACGEFEEIQTAGVVQTRY